MKKLIFLSLIIILVAIIFLINYTQNDNPQACINSNCFNIEIAKTPNEKQLGLMFRPSLDLDQGMLFIFQTQEKHSFWMKNTLIPLDIIWISKDRKIVHIQHNALPCKTDPCISYTPDTTAQYVLEINANLSEQYGFNLKDKVIFEE